MQRNEAEMEKIKTKRMIIGNQAVAYGALAAGVEVAAGYPGTPSSEVIPEFMQFAGNNGGIPYVEWSVNEKVAVEIAAAAAWSGKRAMATMKMSGINVASDSVLSIAYSGTKAGLVIYIADDPGAEAGMPEQDTRVFAQWAGLPVLETESPAQAYEICRYAFELSEQTESPVILRSVTSVAHTLQTVEADFAYHSAPGGNEVPGSNEATVNGPSGGSVPHGPSFERNIFRFTKAGSAICLDQHRQLLTRLEGAEELIRRRGINLLEKKESPLAVISAGNINPYVREYLETAESAGEITALYLRATYPLDRKALGEVLAGTERILIVEELEPVVEKMVRSEASVRDWQGRIFGKLEGTMPRVGKYSLDVIEGGIKTLEDEGGGTAGSHEAAPLDTAGRTPAAEKASAPTNGIPPAKHPITFCAGCPHRGTYVALNRALKKTGLGRKETIVTGDIGCTILGMNPPFDSCWTEVSMGSSIGFAQGFSRAGFEKPVVATIGDSTFFHAGIPPLINAVQHGTDLLLVILDNGWTSMTGFQVNPGTDEKNQAPGNKRVDIVGLVRSIGVDAVETVDPFRQEKTVETLSGMLEIGGVRVIVSREECALTRLKKEPRTEYYTIDSEKCTFCRACLRETGCPALVPGTAGRPDDADESGERQKPFMTIDPELCTGCGLCITCCKFDAIKRIKEEVHA